MLAAAGCPIRNDIGLLTGWIAGALPEGELIGVLRRPGFSEASLRERFDAFRCTRKERIARKSGVMGANVFALKSR